MECSVCYETGPCRKLCCGHEFCSGCIKSWYLKGTGTGCPMCRRPIYFRGFRRVQEKWSEDAWETKCSEAFENAVENSMQNYENMLKIWPEEFHGFFRRQAMRHLLMDERMFACLKACGFDAEDIDYVMNETDLYYSKPEKEYHSDPVREKVPHRGRVVHKARRFKKSNVR